MVTENICFLLNQFLNCTAFENVIFCWVMHEQSIIDNILENISYKDCNVRNISLVCDEETLKERLMKDIDSGIRSEDAVRKSIVRIPLYGGLDTEKIDTKGKSAEDVAAEIL